MDNEEEKNSNQNVDISKNNNSYIEPEENPQNKTEINDNTINNTLNINDISTNINDNSNFQNSLIFRNIHEKNFYEAEQSYLKIKNEINIITNTSKESDITELSKENSKMLIILNKLNEIMTQFTKDVPMNKRYIKKKLNNNNDVNIRIQANNYKILNQYRNEYNYLDNKIKTLNDPSHKDYLIQEKELLKEEIESLENEVNNLKKIEEINNVLIEKNLKNPYLQKMLLNRVELDYYNLEHSYNLLKKNSEKNKARIEENDIKIKELLELKERLDKMAKELYNITEYLDVKELEIKKDEDNKKLNRLRKNYNITINALESLKRKYIQGVKNSENERILKEKKKTKFRKRIK